MKWLLVLALAIAFTTTGCGKKTRTASEDDLNDVAQADTANVEAEAAPEALPAVDEGGEAPASSETASAEASSAAETAPSVQGTGELASYTVQQGDTLMKIAFNVYGDIRQWKSIYELNKDLLRSANNLKTGSIVKYDKPANEPVIERNGDSYMIKGGDTLGTIADDIYAKKSKWRKLYENNRGLIKDPNRIYAGFYLYYQITEEEKKEAEEIKARRSGGQQMGSVDKSFEKVAQQGASRAVRAPASMGAPVAHPAQASAPKGDGLDALAAPSGNAK